MQPQFLTPGPSELYFTVQDHIRSALLNGIGSISHRSEEFKSLYKETEINLRKLLEIPEEFAILFAGSATEIWERSLQNLMPQKPGFFINGAFSDKFFKTAEALGFNAETYYWTEKNWDFDRYTSLADCDFIGIAQNETSLGIATPKEVINKIRKINSEAFLAVDMVSGLPFYPADWQNWDSVYFSVQKGFGLPAGLGVWIIRRSKIKSEANLSPHRNLNKWLEAAEQYQTPETPNVLSIYLLGKVCEDMNRRGIDMIRSETSYKAALTYNAIDTSPFLKPFVQDKAFQSKTTIVAECRGVKSDAIIDHLLKSGIQIGNGYGKHSDTHIRIANFPTHSKEVFERLVDALEEFRP
ncbi:MAG: aminotransferase class V-fold PLP-dependent enzyme [Cytophagales bacterium]